MDSKIKKTVQYVLFFVLSLVLLYYAFKGEDISKIVEEIKQADYRWVALSLLVTLINHMVRAVRWQMLITTLHHKPKLYNTFLIMMSGYLVNTIVPRLGEFTKPAFMSKKEKVPFSVTLGTIVVERLADLIMLFLLIFFVITTQHDLLYNFFAHDIFAPIIEKFTSSDGESSNKKWYIIGAIVLIAGYWGWNYLDKKTKDEKSADKINEFADNMMMGLTSFQKLKSKTLFLGYTLLIWVLYFFMTYTCFFSLEATSGLSVAAGVALVTIGSLGRSVPVQAGGMGAYHWIISSALVLYAINKESGLALATIIHAAQTLFYLVLGGISMLIISVTKDAE
jgi:glycosyltransferase 2 family protein